MNQTLSYTGNLWDLAESSCCQTFANFPRENSWVFPLALDYGGDDTRGEEARPAPSYGLGLEESGAAVTAQDLTDAPVGNLEECAVVWRTNVFVAHLGHFFHQKKSAHKKRDIYPKYPGYLAWTNPLWGQLYHFPPLWLGERSAIEKHPS